MSTLAAPPPSSHRTEVFAWHQHSMSRQVYSLHHHCGLSLDLFAISLVCIKITCSPWRGPITVHAFFCSNPTALPYTVFSLLLPLPTHCCTIVILYSPCIVTLKHHNYRLQVWLKLNKNHCSDCQAPQWCFPMRCDSHAESNLSILEKLSRRRWQLRAC